MTVVEGLYSGLAAGSPPRGGRRLSTAGPAAQAAAAEAKMVRCLLWVLHALMCALTLCIVQWQYLLRSGTGLRLSCSSGCTLIASDRPGQ
jgi:hypothetical protein